MTTGRPQIPAIHASPTILMVMATATRLTIRTMEDPRPITPVPLRSAVLPIHVPRRITLAAPVIRVRQAIEGNRALLFSEADCLPESELRERIAAALTYRLYKKGNRIALDHIINRACA